MSGLNETPSGNRLHIGIFGKTNSGKSSFINALTKQQVSIVSEVAGTTTDPVYKPMEINPLGACVLIDTAGLEDNTELGEMRQEKTKLAAEKTDIAVIVVDGSKRDGLEAEKRYYLYFKEKNIPVLIVINKADLSANDSENKIETEKYIIKALGVQGKAEHITFVSAKSGYGMDGIREELTRLIPENFEVPSITRGLVKKGETVMLVMPQDIQAPKGRLILPQVQTLRELLDRKCHTICVTTEEMVRALDNLKNPPELIITDSQVFDYVYENKPEKSRLTSFSVLFAAQKGDMAYYIDGAKQIDRLTENSRVLIAECCTHAPLTEDIGRVKIPAMLKKKAGNGLKIDIVSGTDFPEDPGEYDLIIQCGGCMFNRRYVMSRIEKAKAANVPMTNYGITIAYVKGILDKIEK